MRFGAVTFFWTVDFSDADLGLVDHAASLGCKVLQIPVFAASRLDHGKLRERFEQVGIGASIMAISNPEADVSSEDSESRQAGVTALMRAADLAAAVGAHELVGPLYRAVGRKEYATAAERRGQLERAAEGLRAVADHAGQRGVRLAIEPINRFESDLVNTVSQGLELCDLIAAPNVGLMPDIFHLNIEEHGIPEALETIGDRLFALHVCDNDRGVPGAGNHVPWADISRTLTTIGFDGDVVFESWAGDLEAGWAMWRPYFPDRDAAVNQAMAFLDGALASQPTER